MAQEGASRRLTLILSGSLIAVLALGVWIAVLIGHAQPTRDPDSPTTTSSSVEQSDVGTEGDGAGEPPPGQESVGDQTPTEEASAPTAQDVTSEPSTVANSEDGNSDDEEAPSEPAEDTAPPADPTGVQQSSP